MKRLLLAASLVLALFVPAAASSTDTAAVRTVLHPTVYHLPGCAKLYTVAEGKRAARRVYAGTRRVRLRDLRRLGHIEHCQRWPAHRGLVRAYDHHQAALHRERVWATEHPFDYATASDYDDAGSTASGWHAHYGFADCGSGGGPCYAFGTRVEFCYHGCVVATADDHGPYVAGRSFDLSTNTAGAIGFEGVDTVRYRVR